MIRSLTISVICLIAFPCFETSAAEEPTKVDYSSIAFYPKRWETAQIDFNMLAWDGEHVTFLAKEGKYDEKQMASFIQVLDKGWQTQQELVGRSPKLFRQLNGKPTICAIPKLGLSCGYGCGYVGSTGIEVAGFYEHDWPAFQANPDHFAHYYFYEMGRNFYVYKHRHSLFTTGYAVFIRYVCMDIVGCNDSNLKTRKIIEQCEEIYAESDIPFLDAFTTFGAQEKQNRLLDKQGKVIAPSDQPVMYATAMLKLRKDYGGRLWW